MAQVYRIGAKIKARLADIYLPGGARALDSRQAGITRAAIRSLRRTCEDGCCAAGTLSSGRTVTVNESGIIIGGSPHAYPNHYPIGAKVAQAVRDGLFLPVGSSTPTPEPTLEPAQVGSTAEPGQTAGGHRSEPEPVTPGPVPPTTTPEPVSPEPTTADPDPEPTGQTDPAAIAAQGDVFDRLVAKLRALREYLGLSADPGQEDDTIGLRPFGDGARMLKAGIPLDAVLDACTLDWPQEARQSNGITEYDPASHGERREGYHPTIAYVLALVRARVPVFLIGPAGTGKSRLAADLADVLGLGFDQIPCAEGISPAWLAGRNMPGSFIETGWIRRYRDGGVFLLDEIDALDPNLGVLLNGALAGSRFDNPVADQIIPKHDAFIPIAAGNTPGTGADHRFHGRNALDAATLDRFRMGRVRVGYDATLEQAIVDSVRDNDLPALTLANGEQV